MDTTILLKIELYKMGKLEAGDNTPEITNNLYPVSIAQCQAESSTFFYLDKWVTSGPYIQLNLILSAKEFQWDYP
jgi:hypothetical protein